MASESNPNPRAEVVSFSKRAAGAARGGVLKRQFPGLRLAGGSAPVPATQKITASPREETLTLQREDYYHHLQPSPYG